MSDPTNHTTPTKSKPYLTCEEVIDFIASYVERTLSPEQLHEFERHLAVCPSCVNYLRSYETTIKLGKAAMQPSDRPAADAFPEGLVQAIAAARRDRPA